MKNNNIKPIIISIFIIFLFLAVIIGNGINNYLSTPNCWVIPEQDLKTTEWKEPSSENIPELKTEFKEINSMIFATFGKSMLPTINEAEYCSCTKQNNYYKGDIISFYWENNNEVIYVSHRIIDIGEDDYGKYYLTRGDNNKYIDQVILRDDNIFCKIDMVSPLSKFIYNIGK